MRVWVLLLVFTCSCSFATTRSAHSREPLVPPALRTRETPKPAPSPRALTHRPAPAPTAPPASDTPRLVPGTYRPPSWPTPETLAPVGTFALVLGAIGFILWRSRHRVRPLPTIPIGLPVAAHDADLNCAYCRSVLRGTIVSCSACATPYHSDCARILTACAIYACGSVHFQPGSRPTFIATAALRA